MSSFQGVGIEEFTVVFSYQGVGIEEFTVYSGVLISGCWNRGVHCIQRCPIRIGDIVKYCFVCDFIQANDIIHQQLL